MKRPEILREVDRLAAHVGEGTIGADRARALIVRMIRRAHGAEPAADRFVNEVLARFDEHLARNSGREDREI